MKKTANLSEIQAMGIAATREARRYGQHRGPSVDVARPATANERRILRDAGFCYDAARRAWTRIHH